MKDIHSELVSVIMPTYNRENTIERAIKSILNQTYKNLELIIVDDGSKDQTIQKIEKIKDGRIKLIKLEKNMGANYARNCGLALATGDYITFQDSDDEAYITKIEKQLNYLKDNKKDIVFCNVRVILKKGYSNEIRKYINPLEVKKRLLWGNFISLEAIFCKSEVLNKIKFDEELTRFQDWDLLIRISYKYEIFHMNEELVNIYVQKDSITSNPKKGYDSLIKILEKYDNIFNRKQKAKIYCRIGIFSARNNQKEDLYFKKALQNHFNIKYLILYLLNKLNLIVSIWNLRININNFLNSFKK